MINLKNEHANIYLLKKKLKKENNIFKRLYIKRLIFNGSTIRKTYKTHQKG